MLVVERNEAARRTNVPNYVTESSYTEDIPARTFVGDPQDKRMLAVMNLESGKTVWAESTFAGSVARRRDTNGDQGQSKPEGQADGADGIKPQAREVRWGMPIISGDGSLAIANARAIDNKDRWLVAVDPSTGKSRAVDVLHDDAWVREIGGPGSSDPTSFGWLPDQKQIWFLSERDGWMHLYAIDPSGTVAVPRRLLWFRYAFPPDRVDDFWWELENPDTFAGDNATPCPCCK